MKQLDVLRSLRTRVNAASICGVLALSVMTGGGVSAQTPTDGADLTPDGMLRYLATHRDDAALVAYTVRDDGGIDRTDGVLSHNADMRMPLGSITSAECDCRRPARIALRD